MKKTTLKDIAEDTGYSISTVSRGLKNSDKISIQTKKEIHESANKLNYIYAAGPNSHAETKFLKIALIISGFHIGEFYASFYKGFTEAAEEFDILLSIVSTHKPKSYLSSLAEELSISNDGIILYTPEYNHRDYLQLKKKLPQNYPVISNGVIENPVFTTINFDGYSGGHMAAVHFNRQRYRRCGIIKGPLKKAEARYRFNGFQDYIAQHKKMEISWSFQGDFSFKSGSRAFEAFQQDNNRPRAIFAANDAMCHAFMEAAIKKGYRFPRDIAIVGYDDLPICQHHQPTISSISTPYRTLGYVTIETLQKNIMRPKKQKSMLSFVPVSLVKRESS